MTARVVLAETARSQIRKADGWWRGNRSDAPTLFADELESALTLLETAPEIAPRSRRSRRRGIRRLLLRRTRFQIYYAYDRATSIVLVVAIWGAVRGHGPPLALLR